MQCKSFCEVGKPQRSSRPLRFVMGQKIEAESRNLLLTLILLKRFGKNFNRTDEIFLIEHIRDPDLVEAHARR